MNQKTVIRINGLTKSFKGQHLFKDFSLDIRQGEGKTIIITSHDLGETEKIASRVTMIKKGNLVFDKNVDELDGQTLEDLFLEVGRNGKKL